MSKYECGTFLPPVTFNEKNQIVACPHDGPCARPLTCRCFAACELMQQRCVTSLAECEMKCSVCACAVNRP